MQDNFKEFFSTGRYFDHASKRIQIAKIVQSYMTHNWIKIT